VVQKSINLFQARILKDRRQRGASAVRERIAQAKTRERT
jgi:hypothetical protein